MVGLNSTDERILRSKQLKLTALSAVPLRIISLFAGMITLAIAARQLSADAFAGWATLVSFVGLLGFADLGLGSSITSSVAELHGLRKTEIRPIISSGLAMLASAGVLLAMVGFILLPFVGVPDALRRVGIGPGAVAAVVLVVASGIPASLALRVLLGLQRGDLVNGFSAAGLVVGLLGVVVWKRFSDSLTVLAVVASIGPLSAGLMSSLYIFSDVRLRPSVRLVTVSESRRLFNRGKFFLLMSLSSAIAFGSDTLILSIVGNSAEVAEYSAVYRLFTFVPSLGFLALGGLWPAISSAIASNDPGWVTREFRRVLKVNVCVTFVASLVLVVFANWILAVWLGHGFRAQRLTLLSAFAYALVNAFNVPVAYLLNGIGAERFQGFVLLLMSIGNVMISSLLSVRFGASGPILGSALALAVASVVLVRHANRHLVTLADRRGLGD